MWAEQVDLSPARLSLLAMQSLGGSRPEAMSLLRMTT